MKNKIHTTSMAIARKAGQLLKSRTKKIKSLTFKGRLDIVTDVDVASEKLIVRAIRRHFPDHSILAEEGHGSDTGSDYQWIIDPLDGTTNFSHDFPFFCVSIAVAFRGEIISGVVYDPMRDELFHAKKGGGAYLNKKKIRVSTIQNLEHAMLATGFPYNIHKTLDDNLDHFREFLKHVQAIRRAGAAALDMSYIACGRFDGYWERNLNPWDAAAGFLIVLEAGGKVTNYANRKWDPFQKEILVSNRKIHTKMAKILAK